MSKEIEEIKAQLAKVLERLSALEESKPEAKRVRLLEEQRNATSEREEKERQERDRAEQERLQRVARFSDHERPPELKFTCEVCGQPILNLSLVKHWINGKTDLCIRKPLLALKQKLITEDQFWLIPEEKQETGYVFEAIGQGDGEIQKVERTDSPVVHPLARDQEYSPIKHATRV